MFYKHARRDPGSRRFAPEHWINNDFNDNNNNNDSNDNDMIMIMMMK